MPTLSTNIAGTVRPFGGMHRRPFPTYGLVSVYKLKKKKKKKGPVVAVGDLVHRVSQTEGRSTEPTGKGDQWVINPSGKTGKWRDAANKHVFWPDDGSGPIGLPSAAKGGGPGSANFDWDGKQAKQLENKLKATLVKLKKKKAPKGAEKAVNDMLNAIKKKDTKAFKSAEGALSKAVKK